MPSILIVDDEANIRSSLEGALAREGYDTETAASVAEARTKLKDAYDVILLDVWFPRESGLDLLGEIAESAPETVVIMMSGHASIDTAVQATRLGAFDFLEKPISLERLLVLLRNATDSLSLRSENRRLRQAWADSIVGDSPAIRALIKEIQLAASSHARVLIQGENGTGKELVARALHAAGPRRDKPFVAVNCAAIPEELIESELFGHERGAFTGATQSRRGRFEEAHGGTLFLDEVGDLSQRAQTKLLRVLEESEFFRVGGNRAIKVDVRVIAATNRDLAELTRAESFREDLYFRLAVVPLTVPPLRDRLEDIPVLVTHIAADLLRETGGRGKTFSPSAIERLARYPYPGNVRELRNVVERLIIMTPSTRVGAEAVDRVLGSTAEPHGVDHDDSRLAEQVRRFEKDRIEETLRLEGGNVTKAAARLGLERSHLYKKMRKLGIEPA
ncbi:MAG TPA: sigma-54 dependent transcriptional regulator [Candidatus Eisenbacteria bacterium]|nr:sigma-54 dependent transcriptional regulator [Candidatus Eisenbacteria bacterium]